MHDRQDRQERTVGEDKPFVFEPEPVPRLDAEPEPLTGPLKWYRIFGISIAILLFVSAVVAVPLALHFANKTEYQTDLDSLEKVRTSIATNEATRDAATELLGLSYLEAENIAADLKAWGSASTTALGKEEAKSLAAAGQELQEGLSKIKPASDGAGLAAGLKSRLADAQADAGAGAGAETDAGADAELPASVIDWSADQAASVLGVLPVDGVEREFSEKYSKAKLEELRTVLEEAKIAEAASTEARVNAVDEVRALSKVVQASRPALVAAAESLPGKVAGLKSAYSKGDSKPVDQAARAAAELAGKPDATAAELHAALAQYFAAVNALAAEHQKAAG